MSVSHASAGPTRDLTATESFTSVVELDHPHPLWWDDEARPVRRALSAHYGGPVEGHTVAPPRNAAALRARLRDAAPRLAELADLISRSFHAQRAASVLVPAVGLADRDLDDRRIGAFALTALLGDPTANIPFGHVIWDVKNRGETSSGHTSFSENDRKAIYHTDNGALRVPEHFFMLYAVAAAQCGGGQTMLRDGRTVIHRLGQTEQGRAALHTLTQIPLPRRIPRAFHPFSNVSDDGFQYTPVFAEEPLWRWRKHGIRKGLLAHPECETAEVRAALDTVIDQLENGPDEIVLSIPTDGALIVNNHIALHGRTAFSDPGRHLLRLRYHQPTDTRPSAHDTPTPAATH